MSGVRHFPEMWEKLMDLQIAIYALDRYFESSWIIQGAELDRLWGRIRKELGVLSDGGGIDEPLRDIQCYQKVEEGLRHGGAEDLPDLPKYYYLKTCDVRLSRVLLEECAPVTRRAVRLSSWGVYDAASEVMDDVEDLYEDTENFNGNRLLLGIGLRGVEATLDGYNTFLKLLEREAVRLGRPADRLSEQLPLKWALDRIARLQLLFARWRTDPDALKQLWARSALQSQMDADQMEPCMKEVAFSVGGDLEFPRPQVGPLETLT